MLVSIDASRVRVITAAVFVATLLFCQFGCAKPLPAKMETRAGDPIAAGVLTYNVVETMWKNQLDAFPVARIPERNFLLIHVTVTNGGGKAVSFPMLTLEDPNGNTYSESSDGAGVEGWLGMLRRIDPAQTSDGWLLFDVPTNSYKLRVSDGGIESEKVSYIDIPLTMRTQ